ncbi:MAG: endo-1,3-alpha-glucanase family glycosylhydrolase [Candidatus Promineifilaceae bacterium]
MNRTKKFTRKPLSIILSLFFLLLLGGRPQTAATQGQTRLVLAFYYAWYAPSSFGPGLTPFQPPTPYASTSSSTIQRHVSEARSAGIDGFVQSWYGPAPNQTESNFKTLLDIASANGFKAAVDFEAASPFFNSGQDRIDALATLLATHVNHPAYLRVDGKPVIFFWANWILSVDEWAAIRNQVDPNHNTIWIAEGANTDFLAVFDGLHLYNIAWSSNPAGTAATYASQTRSYGGFKYWVATAMPGFDDTLLGRGDNSVYRDRAGGAYYQSSFNGAALSAPDMIIINSYNEWAEGSNIEPAVEFGSTYLDLTAQLVSGFKSGNVAAPPPVLAQPTATEGPSPTVGPTNTPGPTAVPTGTPTPFPSPTAQEDGRVLYTVVAGDTLLGIAARFDVEFEALLELNNMTADSFIAIGQELLLGYAPGTFSDGTPTPESVLPGTTLRDDGAIVYIVKTGDTLTSIGITYGLTLDELYELNNIDETTLLSVGEEIIVGRQPIPQNVGGSSDEPTVSPSPTATLTPTPPPTATPEPTATDAPSPEPTVIETAAESLQPTVESLPIEPEDTHEILPVFIGVVVLLALTGGLFIYLGRNH